MTNADLVREYRATMQHIERVVSSVHGVLTAADNQRVDYLRAELISRGIERVAMSDQEIEDFHYNLGRI